MRAGEIYAKNMTFGTDQVFAFLVILSLLMVAAHFAGALFRYVKLPAVVGELGVGILVGPTLLGAIDPALYHTVFARVPEAKLALDSLLTICSVFLLFVVGIEIKMSDVFSHKKAIASLGGLGIIIPLIVGSIVGWLFITRAPEGVTHIGFIAIFGAIFAVSALPVIARVLMDLDLFKSRLGTIIIGSAAVNDLVGWLLFIFALSLAVGGKNHESVPLWLSVTSALVLIVLAIRGLPKLLDAVISKAASVLKNKGAAQAVVVMPLLFIMSAATEYLGLHALFGALVLGIALSESVQFHGALREAIEVVTSSLFAPLYFVAVGLKADFLSSVDVPLVVMVLVCAFLSKIAAALIGGKVAHLTTKTSFAAGLGLAARGGMGIIVASVAFAAGAIGVNVFEAFIVMAIVTSFTAIFIPRFLEEKTAT